MAYLQNHTRYLRGPLYYKEVFHGADESACEGFRYLLGEDREDH